ncbi:exodeoxyribonuclease VII small subunit [Pseudonocardia nantongensis]|uniref:exodeoxyribonuclease VII small subunit n=1 Tax=Pseudonocardia nantongensis TaxID=1181885 RepID=UPI0039795C98
MSEWPSVDTLDYEKARDELVEVVRALEVGGLGLDESVALWERGEALARRCEDQLAGARTRIEAKLAEADPDPDAED